MKIEDLILPGALLIGGYFLLKYLKPVKEVAEAVAGGVAQFDASVIRQPETINNIPISPSVHAPSPINYGLPITGIPGFVDFVTTNPYTGEKGAFAVRDSLVMSAALVAQDLGLIPKKKPTATVRSKSVIPIVSKTPTGGVKIMRPLEIVQAGKAIKAGSNITKQDVFRSKTTRS